MDTQQLSYFLTLCDTLNYTAAAERCFITRQAMRQSIQALEAAYGLPLIENRKNRLSLTPAGRLLREKAQPVVAAYAELETTMRSCTVCDVPLRIGISHSLLPFYSPELAFRLEQFPVACPGLSLDLQMMTADEVVDALSSGALDAGFVVDDGPLPFPFQRIVLREDPMTILVSSAHPLAARRSLSLSDLDGLPFNIMSQPEVCFSSLSHALRIAGSSPDFRIVPEYIDASRNIRDNRSVAIDRCVANPTGRIGSSLTLRLEDDRFTLHLSLLIPQHSAPATAMLAAYLQDNS